MSGPTGHLEFSKDSAIVEPLPTSILWSQSNEYSPHHLPRY